MIVVGKENLMFRAYRGTTSKNVQKVVVSMFYAKLEYSDFYKIQYLRWIIDRKKGYPRCRNEDEKKEIKKITYETLTPKWAPDENLNFEFVPASSKNVKRLIIFKRHKIFGNDAVAKCRVRNKLTPVASCRRVQWSVGRDGEEYGRSPIVVCKPFFPLYAQHLGPRKNANSYFRRRHEVHSYSSEEERLWTFCRPHRPSRMERRYPTRPDIRLQSKPAIWRTIVLVYAMVLL
ncbi:hypothetical protein PGB90_005161 [Kerria lacca]